MPDRVPLADRDFAASCGPLALLCVLLGWPVAGVVALIGLGQELDPAVRAAHQASRNATLHTMDAVLVLLFGGGLVLAWLGRRRSRVSSACAALLAGIWLGLAGYVAWRAWRPGGQSLFIDSSRKTIDCRAKRDASGIRRTRGRPVAAQCRVHSRVSRTNGGGSGPLP